MDIKFFECVHCGNIIAFVKDSGVTIICCGEDMQEIIPNTIDASYEKHVPAVTVNDNKVTVQIGSEHHPMVPEHYIEWVCLQTSQGNQRKVLKAGNLPQCCFRICDGDKVEAVYAYCNLHGLWKA